MRSDTNHSILEAKNLSIGYKTKKAETVIASHIDFSLYKGELVGLVGANGIGKSTLLRTLTKVQPKLDGAIILNGDPIEITSDIELARSLSVVLTETVASKNLTVFELVALGRQPYTNWIGHMTDHDQSIVRNAISKTNIDAFINKKCYELSDGQLQKVMIARALAQDTDLIILDEPTTHLDMYHKAYILKLLQTLAKDTGKTILFSSHEIDLAIQLCDRMVVMTKDTVVTNTPKELIKQGVFKTLFPKDLIDFNEQTGSFRVKK